ncbi:septin-4 isoform X1 [Rousettus aegyptiacus]|uniref:septin-4 isoform X1 n=1 Tax=Rousettus aegyptiacus TaxID=9407 RepID=UPI00168CF41C|nr:septin-4 isoform X1 [Rousettus aegyptiacus]
MGSTQRGSIYQTVKMNKTGSKVAASGQKGAETTNTSPQRGHGYNPASSQRSVAVSKSPSMHQRPEAGNPTIPSSSSYYSQSLPLQLGPGFSGGPIPRTEQRSKSEAYRHSSLQRKIQQSQTSASNVVPMQRNVSPSREESPRRGRESKSGRDISNRYPLTSDTKSSRRLSFVDQKNDIQVLQEEDPPSKVQYPQGVRVPRKTMVCPKDEAVQTDPIRKYVTSAEVRSSRRPSSPEHGSSRIYADPRTAQRKIPGQESDMSRRSSIYAEPKALHRNINVESSPRPPVLKDLDGGHRVPVRSDPESILKYSAYSETKPSPKVLPEVESNVKSSIRRDSEVGRRVTISPGVQSPHRMTSRTAYESRRKPSMSASPEPIYKQHIPRPLESVYMSPEPIHRYPEPSRKPSIREKLELTPRPLPPRSLPRYGPESSWWALLNPEIEMPQSRPTTPDLEPKSPPPLDPSLSCFEMDSSLFYEDVMFQREKASPSPPAAPSPSPPAAPSPSPPPSLKESPSQAPLRKVPQAPKYTSKEPIQRCLRGNVQSYHLVAERSVLFPLVCPSWGDGRQGDSWEGGLSVSTELGL